jgi:hypothetical protein
VSTPSAQNCRSTWRTFVCNMTPVNDPSPHQRTRWLESWARPHECVGRSLIAASLAFRCQNATLVLALERKRAQHLANEAIECTRRGGIGCASHDQELGVEAGTEARRHELAVGVAVSPGRVAAGVVTVAAGSPYVDSVCPHGDRPRHHQQEIFHMQLRSMLAGVGVTTLGLVGVGLAAPASVSAAVKYFSTTRTVSGIGSANCPSGTKLTGGGVGTLPADRYSSLSSDEYQLTGSYPSGASWRTTATKTHGTYSSTYGWRFSTSSYSPKAYAVCAG